jgi:ubiquinone biosynthesis protein
MMAEDAKTTIHDLVSELMTSVVSPLRDTAVSTARLVKHVGVRLDALSLDLARDLGAVSRDVQSMVGAARDHVGTFARATPRTMRLAHAAAGLLARYRWLRLAAAARGHDALRPEDHRELARHTARLAAELRGGIAKLGQLAACRPDLVGPIWASELAALQADVPAIDAAVVRARIEAELGAPIADLFADFTDAPLAAASLAQVHAARLADGTEVVVKVQVPGADDVIAADIAALRTAAGALDDVPGLDLAMVVDELSRALTAELDYLAEAETLRGFKSQLAIPRPIGDRSSARVLTMTRLAGDRLTPALVAMPTAARDRVLAQLIDDFAAQILVHGHVHADPHPGNFVVAGDRLGLLDFGCTLRLTTAERAAYARLVLAIAGGDHVAAAAQLGALGFVADAPDQLVALTGALIGALSPGVHADRIDWQAAFAEQVARAKQIGGLVIPRSFVLLGRVLASLAGLLATYRPAIELHAVLGTYLLAAATAA